ncbi:MAG: BtrH N-terminal domain-containing protein [Clostridia bacterium]|nr:BtrH N-terminal domain-containing protein [Clostridia bacterium]
MDITSEQTRKLLPRVNPSLQTFAGVTHTLSILESFEKETKPWRMENYIVLQANVIKAFGGQVFMNFYTLPNLFDHGNPEIQARNYYCPYFNVYSIPIKDYAEKVFNPVIGSIINFIDDGCYVELPIDLFAIERFNMPGHFLHTPLIYGYDKNEQVFYMSDFANEKKYEEMICTFEEIEDAFNSGLNMAKNNTDPLTVSIFAKSINIVKYHPYNHEFDIKRFCEQIYDQIHPGKSTQYYRKYELVDKYSEKYWGTDIYDALEESIKYSHAKGEIYDNLRPFHLIYDHKKGLSERFVYCSQLFTDKQKDILTLSENMKELANDAEELRNKIVKNRMRKKLSDQELCMHRLKDIKNREVLILTEFLELFSEVMKTESGMAEK